MLALAFEVWPAWPVPMRSLEQHTYVDVMRGGLHAKMEIERLSIGSRHT